MPKRFGRSKATIIDPIGKPQLEAPRGRTRNLGAPVKGASGQGHDFELIPNATPEPPELIPNVENTAYAQKPTFTHSHLKASGGSLWAVTDEYLHPKQMSRQEYGVFKQVQTYPDEMSAFDAAKLHAELMGTGHIHHTTPLEHKL